MTHVHPPRRIQLRRTRGWRKPPGAIVVTRPGKWGNPFPVEKFGHEEAVRLHRDWILFRDPAAQDVYIITSASGRQSRYDRLWMREHLAELRGKTLACWCPLTDSCHTDILLELARADALLDLVNSGEG